MTMEFLRPLTRIFRRGLDAETGSEMSPYADPQESGDLDADQLASRAAWREAYAVQIKEILASLIDNRSHDRNPQKVVMGGINCARAVTPTCVSLAMACASNGLRVLLVDANFVAPRLHEDFGVDNEIGMSTLLCSSDPPHRMIQRTEFANLDLLTSGPSLPGVSSSMARQRLFHRLQPIGKRYDFVFVDAGQLEQYHLANIAIGADNLVVAVQEHVASLRELERVCQFLRGESVPPPSVLIVE
ncbi:tyrosine-protein kinase family protein [Altererythrobacter sp. Z27]|uniref:tyrosine-protein kinase family protein n=1 Tax=Altererythrobacter sp. Z27 TaxID=3461147 RepID=UPI004044B947